MGIEITPISRIYTDGQAIAAVEGEPTLVLTGTVSVASFPASYIAGIGTWTPILTFVTPGDLTVVYNTQEGFFSRITSNLYWIQFNIETSTFTHTTASGQLLITGLPAASENTPSLDPRFHPEFQGITKANYTQFNLRIANNTSQLNGRAAGSGQTISVIDTGDMPTTGTVRLNANGIYRAA